MDFDNHPTADLDPQMIDQPDVLAPPLYPDVPDAAPPPANPPSDDDDDDDDDAGGLFGDDDDDDMDQDQPQHQADDEPAAAPEQEDEPMYDDGLTEEERQRRRELEYDEGDEEAMQVTKEERIAQIELANYGVPTGGKVWHARLPNFLQLNTQPFDPKTCKAPVPDENVIRWRWTKDELGDFIKQSNSRIVRWSDGSLSLQVGSELFDISLSLDHSAVLSSTGPTLPVLPSLSSGASGLSSSTFDQNRGHGLTYLTAKHDYTELIEAQASVHGTLTFRPTTLQSNTHRRLASSIANRNVKGRATKIAALPDIDPEKRKAEREKAELDKAKKAKRDAAKSAGGRKKGAKRATRMIGYSDEEDDGEGDEDDEERGFGSRSQPIRGAGGPLSQREEEYEEEDGFVAPDDEEEEEQPESSEGELDAMDEAEARIEREERRKKEMKARGEEAAPAPAPRRRLVVDDSDEE
ncbi:Leo1-like protein-domain-containing protein [Leucosporidium creatinivorum]|uniref:Leo1-like protein-domain-containing protein n=1 Tax=Leucosporidium creatinivorum TaxID=106004 RepID=A0A1Y2F3M0_9BASI|nr:Leo1-like protein-domain-containing protein [Leucosporidium creatinivorum]